MVPLVRCGKMGSRSRLRGNDIRSMSPCYMPSCPRRRASISLGVDLIKQIMPIGIKFFDQADFPGAAPLFEAFFAQNGVRHSVMYFIIHQLGDVVCVAETRNRAGSVLPNALP